MGQHGMQQQPAAGSPELTLGQLRPVAPALQHVAAQEQQQPESPAKPLLHHSEFVAPQVNNKYSDGQSALCIKISVPRLMHPLRAAT